MWSISVLCISKVHPSGRNSLWFPLLCVCVCACRGCAGVHTVLRCCSTSTRPYLTSSPSFHLSCLPLQISWVSWTTLYNFKATASFSRIRYSVFWFYGSVLACCGFSPFCTRKFAGWALWQHCCWYLTNICLSWSTLAGVVADEILLCSLKGF